MNWEITIPALITVGGMIFTAGGFYFVTRGDSQRMRSDINDIKADLKTLNKVVMDVALQNQRLDNQADRITGLERAVNDRLGSMERRWEELRRGEGRIVERVGG